MEAEQDRLRQLYAEMGDEPLMNLASEPDDLTTEAHGALQAELRRRGLQVHPRSPVGSFGMDAGVDGKVSVPASDENERAYAFGAGIPGVIPAGGSAVETALEPGGEVRQGMSALVSLYDGHELTRACQALEEAGMEFALEEIAGDASMGTPSRFEIWVEPSAQERSRGILRERLGLFPPAEIVETGESGSRLAPDGDLVVAEFDTIAEAHQVRAILLQQGFAARIEDDGSEFTRGIVIVPAAEQERALEVLAARLGLG